MAYPKFIGSSVDPEKLSLTIKSVLYGAIPTVVLVAKLKGWDIGETQLTNMVDVLVQSISSIMVGASAAAFLFGLCRKAYYAIKDYIRYR